jgi:hypothetical protein
MFRTLGDITWQEIRALQEQSRRGVQQFIREYEERRREGKQ